jgi:oleate hydratase
MENNIQLQDKRRFEQTEAWILGSGTASLASAFYLIKFAKIPPSKVHILESRDSAQEILHQKGDPNCGYDQFAGCLPLPIGEPLKELLASIPSLIPTRSGSRQTYLGEIETEERRSFPRKFSRTNFLVQKNHILQNLVTGPLDLQLKHRMRLAQLILRPEPKLGRNQIKDFFCETFFETTFWAIWSAQ